MRPAPASDERQMNGQIVPDETASAPVGADAIRQALEKILSSPGFAASDRLSRFLRHSVEASLLGETDRLKESLLGIEVFGRKPSYDPRIDAVVRTEAVKLRARLKKYYEKEGAGDAVVIDLPKGGYVALFRFREPELPPGGAAVEEPPHNGAGAPGNLSRNTLIAGVAIALALLGSTYFSFRHRADAAKPAALSSIAVLPFSDLSPQKDQEYFCDGMTDEVIDALTKAGGFRVVARTSSFAFKGKQLDIRDIGNKLNVGAVLEGSVRKDGKMLRVTAQLISVADGYHMWSETYERELKDVFKVQDEISRAIVDTLQVKLTNTGGKLVRGNQPDLQTYDLYLQGRYHWSRWRLEGARQAVGYFEQAIARDPKYAEAYAGLSYAYCWMGFFGGLPPNEAMPKAKAYSERALALDDTLPAAHVSLGYVKGLYEWDWPGAEREFKRAIELNPNFPDAHFAYGLTYLAPMGRTKEALDELEIARRLDPLSLVINTYTGLLLTFNNQVGPAIEQYKKTLDLDPTFVVARGDLAMAYMSLGRFPEAEAELKRVREQTDSPALFPNDAFLLACEGKREDALKALAHGPLLHAGSRLVRPTSVANVYAQLGDKENAMLWLNKAYAERDGMLAYTNAWHFEKMHGDPRFNALLGKLGLPH